MKRKTMSGYACYCTEEQTEKAFKLGAPIETQGFIPIKGWELKIDWFAQEDKCYHIPTTEQMIGWLEEQIDIAEIDISRCSFVSKFWAFGIYNEQKGLIAENIKDLSSRKEATLAAIDAALEYLINNKKGL